MKIFTKGEIIDLILNQYCVENITQHIKDKMKAKLMMQPFKVINKEFKQASKGLELEKFGSYFKINYS